MPFYNIERPGRAETAKGRDERTAARHHTQQSLSPHRDFKERSVVLAPSRRPHPWASAPLLSLFAQSLADSSSRSFPLRAGHFFKKRNAERHLSPTRKRRDPVSCVLPPKLWLPTFARPNLCSADLQVLLPWLPLASPLARRDAARDESCPRAGPLASPHNHHCSEPVPGCTPCCDRRRARGSLRESPRIWHNRIADLSAAERAAAGRLHA